MNRRLCSVAIASLMAGGLFVAGCTEDEGSPQGEPPLDGTGADVRGRDETGSSDAGSDVPASDLPSGSCRSNSDCYDENPCTTDFCDDNTCFNTPNPAASPAQIPGNCRREECVDGVLVLTPTDGDPPADDGIECTLATCVDGEIDIDVDDDLCDDGNLCNGIEVCDVHEGCRPGPPADYDEDGTPDLSDPSPPDADSDGIIDCADWETCDGIDNDNNGLVDDGPQDEELGGDCYDGPPATDGVGQCAPGVLACLGGAVRCTEQILPAETEYCDGMDNDCDGMVPNEEVQASCTTEVFFGPDDDGPQVLRVEFPTALREVDVHFNVDTTGSMSGILTALRESLSSDIVPGVAEVIPSAAFGVSTFEDYPLFNFGSGTDLPFELWQRVTTRVDLVQTALGAITLGAGNDIPESGVESLYQLATGAGTRWPRRDDGTTSYDPSTRNGFVGEIDPVGDLDFFRIHGLSGERVDIDVDAHRVGAGIDLYLELYDSTGRLLGANDDSDGLDPALNLSLDGVPPFYLKIRGLFGSTTGWYYVQVLLAGTPQLPAENTCTEIEVGDDVFAGTGDAVDLRPIDEATPRPDPAACFVDCDAVLESTVAGPWIRSHCFAGGTESCGDGEVDGFEECDDGNRISGDGCSGTCSMETEGVPRFAPELGYDPNLGHGLRGGAGFRDNALPIIVHATDAASHPQADYLARDARIEAHGADETFHELEKLGARIVGLAARSPAQATIDDPYNPPGMAFRTGANVPPCAFDGTEPRLAGRCAEDECCVGIDGQGELPRAGAGGLCTLSFQIGGDGTGLTDATIGGIQALARFATYTVTPILLDDPRNPRDARCFVQSVEVVEVIPASECVPELRFADRDEDGFLESILNATPRTRIVYRVVVENRDLHDFDGDLDTAEPCGPPGTYYLGMEVVGDDVATLSSHTLTFTIDE